MHRRDFLNATALAVAWQVLPQSVRADDAVATGATPGTAALAGFSREAAAMQRLNSVVVSRRGEILLAEAFHGPAIDKAVNVKSVSKTLVATLVGIAEQRGVIESVQQTLGELTPGLVPSDADPRVADLSLENLMTMRAGLERVSGPAYGRWVNSDNWVRYVLTRPLIAQPGTRMLYSTGDTHVLGAVLSELTAKSLYTLANEWLGDPLGIDFAPWTRDPQGYYLGGNEMSVSPVHLVRVGEMYLTNGAVADNRVLPTHWVSEAFSARTRSPYSGDGYGYGWFLRDMGGVVAAYARGYGGQVLYVVPERDLSIVITSDPTQRARSNGYMSVLHGMVQRYLL